MLFRSGRVPQKNPGKPKPAPAHVLLATLEVLLEDPAKSELAYLLSLLLIRRRILVEPSKIPIDEQEEAKAEGEDSEEESPLLHLTHPPSNRDFVVPKSIIDLQQSQALQEELNQLLFSES